MNDQASDHTAEAPLLLTNPVNPAPRGRKRRAIWPWVRGIGLIALLPVLCALIIPVLLIGQEITAPSWIKTQVEEQAAEVLGGGALTFGEITVTIAPDLHPTVRIREAELRDADGVLLARVPQIDALVSPRGLLFGPEILPQEISLSGAEMTLRRARDGSVQVSFDRPETAQDVDQTLPEILGSIDAAFDIPALAALETVQIDGLILNYDDARASRSWVVDGGQVALNLTAEDISLTGDFSVLSGRAYVTTVGLNYVSARGSPAAEVSLDIVDVAAVDVATQSPALSWLSVLQSKVSASLRGTVDAQGQLGVLHGTVDIGAGALQPVSGTQPVGFDGATASLRFDPVQQRIWFERVELQSEWGALQAQGHADLQDLEGGLPETLVAQFEVVHLSLNPGGLYEQPLDLREVSADFRLRLDPFVADIGYLGARLGLDEDAAHLTASGQVRATAQGWDVQATAGVPHLTPDQLLTHWPMTLTPGTRRWFENNLLGAEITGLTAAAHISPEAEPVWALTHGFENADVRVLRQWPAITQAAGAVTIQDKSLTVLIDAGRLPAPQGGGIDISGSVFHIPLIGIPEAPAEISLRAQSSITAALALLDEEPFGFLSRAQLPVDLADGQARITGQVELPLMQNAPRDRLDFSFDARLTDVTTTALIPGRRLSSGAIDVAVREGGLTLTGPVRTGAAAGQMEWAQTFGQPGSRLDATVALSPAFLDEFNITLPPGMIGGSGTGRLRVDLARGQPPAFTLSSNLAGITMRLPALGWSKGAGSQGSLSITGQLGEVPRIDQIALDVAGLQASGDIRLRTGGGLDRARFSSVRLGGWLNAAVTLVGRGAGRPVGIEVGSGALDLRRANFGQGGGQSGPMELALDRLQITDSIILSNFRGSFDGGSGLSGRFTALLGGTAPISGTLAPVDGRVGVRIASGDAGAVLSAAGLLETAQGGLLDLTLRPTGGAGSYDGVLAVTDLRVRDAPALASLLDAISVVGLLQQLDGQGLSFTNVDANFRLTPDQVIVTQASAVGPGLGISVDGIYTLAGKVMDFQGVVSPLYLINGVGSFLTRPGEGLFGFNFTLHGPVSQAQVGVNPLSVLTPGMFREIFRRPVPVVQ